MYLKPIEGMDTFRNQLEIELGIYVDSGLWIHDDAFHLIFDYIDMFRFYYNFRDEINEIQNS